jgi:two-component system, LytTR family, response regulator
MTAMLRCLIVDDEPPALAGLRALLARHADVEVCGEALGGRAAIKQIRSLRPDVVLLDVQMPEVDGFAVLRAVGADAMPAVIFVTAHDEFAVHAFDVNAVDYLLKPVAESRLARALDRARSARAAAGDADLARRLRAVLETSDAARSATPSAPPSAAASGHATRLLVRVGQRDVLVAMADVDWIEADDYCSVLHIAGKRHLVRETLGALEARIDPSTFVRIHRSSIVNIRRVAELQRHPMGGVSVVLTTGTRLPVSRARRARLAAALGASR